MGPQPVCTSSRCPYFFAKFGLLLSDDYGLKKTLYGKANEHEVNVDSAIT